MFEDVEVQIKFYYYLNKKKYFIREKKNKVFFTLFLLFLNDNNRAYHNELNVDYTLILIEHLEINKKKKIYLKIKNSN